MIRKAVPKSAGIDVEGKVNGKHLWFTVDTGATQTILSKRIFKQIPKEGKATVCQNNETPLELSDGNTTKEHARVLLEFGNLSKVMTVVIADIRDDALLGLDICRDLDVLASKNRVVMDGEGIPSINVQPKQLRKVRSATDFTVPAYCEAIIDVTVEINDSEKGYILEDMMIEPIEALIERHDLIGTPCLVNYDTTQHSGMRVMNPNNESVAIRKKTVLGSAYTYMQTLQTFFTEDNQESNNFGHVRRLHLVNRDHDVNQNKFSQK